MNQQGVMGTTGRFTLTRESQPGTRFATRASLLTLSLFLLFLSPFCAGADEKPVFGLPQLIKMAVETNPEMAQIRSEIAAAQADLAQAKAGQYPQLDTLTIIGPVDNARRPVVNDNGRIGDPSPDNAVGIFGRADIILSQPLYTFGKLTSHKEAAQQGVKASELRLPQKRNEIVLRVKELYFALVAAREGIEAVKGATDYFDEARTKMSQLLKSGSTNVVESDLYRVDSYRAGVLRSRAEAEKGARIASFALKSLCQIPADQEFETLDTSLPLPDQTGTPESFINQALAGRPELQQLDAAIEARKHTAEAAEADLYPTFFAAAHGSFAGAPGREAFHNPYISDDFNHAQAGVVLGLTWHFDFGITKGRIEKERANYAQLTHTRANARLNIPIQVIKYYNEAREWRTSVETYKTAASASRKWVVSALTSFDMGTGTADDMLRGIERYGENQGKYVAALFNYNVALAQLDYAAGVKNW